jgi:hypothetical protein
MRNAVCLWAKYGWVAGAFFLIAGAAPYLVTEAQIQAQEVRSGSLAKQRNSELEQAESQRVEKIELSRQRLANGCQTLVLNGQKVLIRSGMRGRDGVTGNPLGAGLCISDSMGTTAITDAEGYLTEILPGEGMASGELRGEASKPKEKQIEVNLNDFH